MTEALLIALILASMYLTARLYPKPPRYIRDEKSEIFWLPPLMAHGVDLTPFIKGFKDFDDAIQGMDQTFEDTAMSFDNLRKGFEGTISGTWNVPDEIHLTIKDFHVKDNGDIVISFNESALFPSFGHLVRYTEKAIEDFMPTMTDYTITEEE